MLIAAQATVKFKAGKDSVDAGCGSFDRAVGHCIGKQREILLARTDATGQRPGVNVLNQRLAVLLRNHAIKAVGKLTSVEIIKIKIIGVFLR